MIDDTAAEPVLDETLVLRGDPRDSSSGFVHQPLAVGAALVAESRRMFMRKTAVLVMVVAASVAFALGEPARVGTPMAMPPAASHEAGLINPTVAAAGEPGTWRGVPAFALPTFDHVGWKPVQSAGGFGQIIDAIIRILGQMIDRHK